jgi:putative copper resistance protein D
VLWVVLAVGVAAAVAVAGGSLASSPQAVLVGTAVTRAGMDVAGVACVGLALAGVLLPRREALAGGSARAREEIRSTIDRVLVLTAGAWVGLVLVGVAYRAADAVGRDVGALTAGGLLAYSTRLAAGRGMVLAAGCALAVLVCAAVRIRDPARVQTRLPLVLALFGVLTPAVTGHAGTSADHQLSVITVALHAGAAALWVGGLGAVLVLLRHRAILDHVLPRFSRLAGACLAGVALTGVANALLRLGSVTALFDTQYGWLVLAKTGCLLLLAGLGGLARQRLHTGRTPVLRWAGIEVALMAVTLGLAAALTQSA